MSRYLLLLAVAENTVALLRNVHPSRLRVVR